MKLKYIIDSLRFGELSMLYTDNFSENDYVKILSHINLGLTELHKRFLIRKNSVDILTQEGVNLYVLDSKYSSENFDASIIPYILDTNNPFKNDVLRIDGIVENEVDLLQSGEAKVINYNSIYLYSNRADRIITVEYRASHPFIEAKDSYFDLDEEEVSIPNSHLEALIYYVASRMLNPYNQPNTMHEGNNYAAKFEKACKLLEETDYNLVEGYSFNRFTSNGWV